MTHKTYKCTDCIVTWTY